jgi:hypothetical protein
MNNKYNNLVETNEGRTGINTIYKGNGFEISYNPCTTSSIFDVAFNMFGMESAGFEETALILIKDGEETFAILNGDFRKDYDKCKNLEEALALYHEKAKKYKSQWSEI